MNRTATLTLEQLYVVRSSVKHSIYCQPFTAAVCSCGTQPAIDLVEEAIAEAKRVDPLNGWTRVEDGLPEFLQPVNCAQRDANGVAYAVLHRSEVVDGWAWFDVHGDNETMAVTHWRELPPLPEVNNAHAEGVSDGK